MTAIFREKSRDRPLRLQVRKDVPIEEVIGRKELAQNVQVEANRELQPTSPWTSLYDDGVEK